ncbi:hypothetical protein [Enterobacter hormaechei]|uniref:hypothetical protein n=1 Tax=Enterobacter hormaechei TaxID=158836 RepID=UPI00338142F9
MSMPLVRFGPSIRTIFIDGNNKRAESTYTFAGGPSGEISRRNSEHIKNGVWDVKFEEPAQIAFARGRYFFRTATVVQNDHGYEMFITLMYRKSFASEKIIYTVEEL